LRQPLAALGLLLVACPAAAMDVETVEFSDADGGYVLTMSARLNASVERVFAILTDYPRLAELHETILESRVLGEPAADTADVFTRIRGCVMLFCRELSRTERVTAKPPAFVEAVILPETGDFEAGVVRWDLRSLPGGRTHVDYVAEIQPRFWVPPLVGKRLLSKAMRKTTGELFVAVEARAREVR
jgi:hypothetical protein